MTYEKQGNFLSKVSVGTLSVFDQNSAGSASQAESEGKAAEAWLNTFSSTLVESATSNSNAGSALVRPAALDPSRPFNLVGQLNNSTGIKQGSDSGGASGLMLKPVKKKLVMQPNADGVAGQVVPGHDTNSVKKSRSSWAVMKVADFLKSNHTKKAFWDSSFVLLVISAVETCTLRLEKAADMLGVDVQELEKHMNLLKNEEKKFNQGGSLSKKALSKIESEACVRELGDESDSPGANKTDSGHIDDEKRGIKRKASSSCVSWITGKVVVHLLRRSFAMKDQFFPLHSGTPTDFVLRMSWPFYESNVTRVVKEIDEFCGFPEPLMESCEVKELLRAARNLDSQKMEGGGYTLAPSYNYSRCMLEQKANYWETGLPALLLQDVDTGIISAEVAACQLGVTSTMILAAIAGLKAQDKFSSLWEEHSRQRGCDSQENSDAEEEFDDQNDDNWNPKEKESKKRPTRADVKEPKLSGPVTVQRYKECGFGSEEDFWKENTTKDVLQKV